MDDNLSGSSVVGSRQDPPEQDLVVRDILRKDDLAVDGHNLRVLLERNEPLIVCGETRLLRRLLRKQPVTVLKEATERNYSARLIRSI